MHGNGKWVKGKRKVVNGKWEKERKKAKGKCSNKVKFSITLNPLHKVIVTHS